MRFLTALLLLAIGLTLLANAEAKLRGGAFAPSGGDFCSQSFVSGSCTYVYDLGHRRVSSNTVPYQLTRLSDGATHNAGYTGNLVNVSDLTAFCLGNGGTTTALTYSTQYNDCVITKVYEQAGSGCDPVAGGPSTLGTTHAPIFQVQTVGDQLPTIIQANGFAATNSSAKFLFATGCAALDGNAARSMISLGSNAYFSSCCGQYGKIESAPAPGHTPAGSMWAILYYHNSANIDWVVDIEGGSACITTPTPINLTPVINDIGITTYSTTAGSPTYYYNNTLLASGCTPSSAINTQSGMVIGCSGDYTSCGPYYFRGMIFLNTDVSLTPGLPAQIYSYLSSL